MARLLGQGAAARRRSGRRPGRGRLLCVSLGLVGLFVCSLGLGKDGLLLGRGLVAETHCSSTISASTTSSSEAVPSAPPAPSPLGPADPAEAEADACSYSPWLKLCD